MDKEMKYKTLKELKDAFDTGELDKEFSQLRIDNDCLSVAPLIEEEPGEYDHGDPVFYRFGCNVQEKLLMEALDLLGIPNEPV